MEIRVQRSSEWVRDQKIRTGENVPEFVVVDVDPKEFSTEVREFLIDYLGEYSRLNYIRFDSKYVPLKDSGYGKRPIVVDKDQPTAADIEQVIRAILADLLLECQKLARYKNKKKAEADARQQEQQLKEEKLQEARELLASELETGRRYKEDAALLCRVLSKIDDSVIETAVRDILQDETDDRFDELCNQVSQASVSYSVFSD